jgi:thiol peroxidase
MLFSRRARTSSLRKCEYPAAERRCPAASAVAFSFGDIESTAENRILLPSISKADTNPKRRKACMSRPGAVIFKGEPKTLVGEAVKVGQPAPDFTLHTFRDGKMQAIRPADLRGKTTILSVVPSLDTPVCQVQTKKFNEQLGSFGDKINALTVSLDLPFAMNRFCGAEKITNLISASDYQDRSFGNNWGMLIDELKILARGTFVLDASGKVVYAETVKEIGQEPNYEAALAALKPLVQ